MTEILFLSLFALFFTAKPYGSDVFTAAFSVASLLSCQPMYRVAHKKWNVTGSRK